MEVATATFFYFKFNFFKGLKYKKRGPSGHAVGASTFAVRAISRVFLI